MSLLLWHVYVLRDPRDRSARYVGVTEMAPKDRAHRHVSEALRKSRSKTQSPKDAWILRRLETKGAAKRLHGSSAFLRPDVHEAVERTIREIAAR